MRDRRRRRVGAAILGSLALLFAVFVALRVGQGPATAARSKEPPRLPREESRPLPEDAGGKRGGLGPETPSRTAATTADKTVVVRGRLVLKDEGGPIGNATVSVIPAGDGTERPQVYSGFLRGGLPMFLWGKGPLEERTAEAAIPQSRPRAISGEDGTFAVQVPEDLLRFRFDVDAPLAIYVERRRWFALSSPEVRAGVILQLEPCGAVEGTLRDRGGAPLPGALVLLAPEEFVPRWDLSSRAAVRETDPEGRFSFRSIRSGTYVLGAKGPGCAPVRRGALGVRGGEVTTADLVLPGESSVAGVVLGPSGKGIAGARVQSFLDSDSPSGPLWPLAHSSASTDAEGRFRLGSLAPGAHELRVFLAGRDGEADRVQLAVPPGGALDGISFVVGGGERVRGRVLDGQGAPVRKAGVVVQTDVWTLAERHPTLPSRVERVSLDAGPDGDFEAKGLAGGLYVVTASSPERGAISLGAVEAGSEEVRIVLPGPTGIAGTVRDAETGEAVRRFDVSFFRWRGDRRQAGSLVESGEPLPLDTADGAFRLTALVSGDYEFRFGAEGYAVERLDGIAVSSGSVRSGLDVRLRRPPRLKGIVLDRETRMPVPGALLEQARLDGPAPPAGTCSGPDGRFEFICQGFWSIEDVELVARHADYAPGKSAQVRGEPGRIVEGIEIELSRGGAIEGTVRSVDGKPVAGAAVRSRGHLPHGSYLREASTDDQGRFRFERVPEGSHFVERVHAGEGEEFGRAGGAWTHVRDGQVARLEIRSGVGETCTVRGRVVRGGEPIAGALVRVLPEEGWPREVASGTDGLYEARGVRPGKARVEVLSPRKSRIEDESRNTLSGPESTAPAEFSLEIPDVAEFALDLTLPTGEIGGRVVHDLDNAPLAGVLVALQPLEGEPRRPDGREREIGVRTDSRGRYRFSGLSPGSYTVSARAWPAASGLPVPRARLAPDFTGPIRIEEGGRESVDLRLSGGTAATFEVVDEEGRPVPHVAVSLELEGGPPGRASLGGLGSGADEHGIARVGGLRAGSYSARVVGREELGRGGPYLVKGGVENRFRIVVRRPK